MHSNHPQNGNDSVHLQQPRPEGQYTLPHDKLGEQHDKYLGVLTLPSTSPDPRPKHLCYAPEEE